MNKFCFAIIFASIFLFSTAQAATYQELKDSINEKSVELQNIQAERQKILNTLSELDKKGATLQSDIEKNTYQINQLNLAIKSSKINIEKLGLEIESLGYEIKDIEAKSGLEKEAIVRLLRELREKENENFLVILLKNQSLAESVSEVQNLLNLNNGLTLELTNLRQLHEERSQKLDEISQKKSEQELENSNQQNRKLIIGDQKAERQNLLALNKKQEKIYQQRIQELEKIQADINAEIEEIENKLRKEIDPTILPAPRPGVLTMPLPVNLIENLTQTYGATEFAQAAYSSQFHNGIDIRASVGTPVLAAEDGQVMATGNTDNYNYCPPVWYGRKKYGGSYGKYIVIRHENNLSTLYTHLSLQSVKVGAIVKRGDLIGYTGNTGFTTGPHLHFSVYANIYGAEEKLLSPEIKSSVRCGPQPYGATLNPLDYL